MYIERQIGHIYDYLDYVRSQVRKTLIIRSYCNPF